MNSEQLALVGRVGVTRNPGKSNPMLGFIFQANLQFKTRTLLNRDMKNEVIHLDYILKKLKANS